MLFQRNFLFEINTKEFLTQFYFFYMYPNQFAFGGGGEGWNPTLHSKGNILLPNYKWYKHYYLSLPIGNSTIIFYLLCFIL
jgi:hypothetical protein